MQFRMKLYIEKIFDLKKINTEKMILKKSLTN